MTVARLRNRLFEVLCHLCLSCMYVYNVHVTIYVCIVHTVHENALLFSLGY